MEKSLIQSSMALDTLQHGDKEFVEKNRAVSLPKQGMVTYVCY